MAMKLFIESLMIFFGTLLTAALVALGEPANAELAIVQAATQPVPFSQTAPARADDTAAVSGLRSR
jgi:hypothetical protein